ncbi:hypothetical protein [Nocardioides okcheonensis]|uniref:hypothetical protein n=1 Tax=Nocardioides okcheonensis TaxID=2894081 RepID=UPI001E2ADE52|nr:hypothetical protein [Nocardioides okcheonensis]UFN45781.1 hypothetical protein LN652_06100 [Nocardioides okcheonensis]
MHPTTTDDRERRAARRAALRATHPDLGGDVDDFIAVMRAFERRDAPQAAAVPAGGAGTAVRAPRPTITTTRRSRAVRSARRTRRRFASLARGRLRGWPVRQYAHLIEETS